jgi:hypothetical protein
MEFSKNLLITPESSHALAPLLISIMLSGLIIKLRGLLTLDISDSVSGVIAHRKRGNMSTAKNVKNLLISLLPFNPRGSIS